jgi:ATP-dependent RNA helicase DDX49/DBP8
LMGRPHVVIATPGRIKVLLENPDISPVFSRTKVNK